MSERVNIFIYWTLQEGYRRFAILFKVMCRCWSLRFRPTLKFRKAWCLVLLPCTRARHMRNEEVLISRRMSLITSDSASPNCSVIASNGVRSSQAISTMRSMALWSNSDLGFELSSWGDVGVDICTRNHIYPKKFAQYVYDLSFGAKNGEKIGTKSSIAASNADAINNLLV